jgi:alcohol dehydrogenase
MRQHLTIPSTVYVDNFTTEILEQLVTNALSDPCMITNPKEVTFQELRSIYERIFQSNP